ncbi:DUF3226 domain-containing protein, partial [Fretibacterium fastidiosum]
MAMGAARGLSETRGKNTRIEKRYLILCEGRDELFFLIAYLNSTHLSATPGFSEDIQVMDFGGNSDLLEQLKVLKVTPGFDEIKTLLIVRDAERDASSAVRQIRTALENNGFSAPDGPHRWVKDEENNGIHIGFLLFPGCDEAPMAGTLEDLCAFILKEPAPPKLLEVVDRFLDQLKTERGRDFVHRFKTRLHTCLAVSDKYVGMKIGEAAKAGAFDWSDERLTPL